MIIDFHTHCFPDKLAARAVQRLSDAGGGLMHYADGTLEGLRQQMTQHNIDLSVVLNIATKPEQQTNVNNFAATIDKEPDIIAFGSVFPGAPDAFEELERIKELGLKGVKFHPEYQQFGIDEPRMFPIYDYALSKGLMLIFHAGHDPAFDPPWHSSPKRFADVYKTLGGGTIICAHLGGINQWDEVEQYLVGTGIYLDTSMGLDYYSHEQFLRIVKAHGADKILFGSDSPWSEAGKEKDTILSLSLTDEEKNLILCDNAKRLLGIK